MSRLSTKTCKCGSGVATCTLISLSTTNNLPRYLCNTKHSTYDCLGLCREARSCNACLRPAHVFWVYQSASQGSLPLAKEHKQKIKKEEGIILYMN